MVEASYTHTFIAIEVKGEKHENKGDSIGGIFDYEIEIRFRINQAHKTRAVADGIRIRELHEIFLLDG